LQNNFIENGKRVAPFSLKFRVHDWVLMERGGRRHGLLIPYTKLKTDLYECANIESGK